MQQSTTVTSSWIIEKFSRSKTPTESKKGGASVSGSVSKAGTGDAIEWEHRIQKQHYLALESVSSSATRPGQSNTLQRMTLRIIFDALASSNAHQPSPSHQQITLLSLDLTSFSEPSIVACTPKEQLPLKAVYKGTILGLRYLHVPDEERSKGASAQTEFKRLQVKFTSVDERDRFVKAIKGVCPVKLADGAKEEERQLPSPKKSRRTQESEEEVSRATQSPRQPSEGARSIKQVDGVVNGQQVQSTAPKPAPSRSATSARQPLPPAISALLPSLASALSPSRRRSREEATSTELAKLDDETFAELFSEVLTEDGFDLLVERVQSHLNSVAGVE